MTTKPNSKIWIDTTTGTWGEVDGSNGRLVIVDLDNAAKEVARKGPGNCKKCYSFDDDRDSEGGCASCDTENALSLVSFLDGASDDEIAEFGDKYGQEPVISS